MIPNKSRLLHSLPRSLTTLANFIIANNLTSIVSTFIESGDLVLHPDDTLDSIRYSFSTIIRNFPPEITRQPLFNPDYLVAIICTVLTTSDMLSVVNMSTFLSPHDRLPSEELWRAANLVVNSASHKNDMDALSGYDEWYEMMEKCVAETEVFADSSFLQRPCFRPTLLRLQSKYQNIAQHHLTPNQPSPNQDQISSFEPTPDFASAAPSLDIQSSFSLNTAHLSHPSSNLSSDGDESERSDESVTNHPSSLSPFSLHTTPHETLSILNVLHSLISAPLSHPLPISEPLLPFHLRGIPNGLSISSLPANMNEIFSPDIFDEDEDALIQTLQRCNRLCTFLPPEQCITSIDQFVEVLTAFLDSTKKALQSEVFSLLVTLSRKLKLGEIHRKLLSFLRLAFRDESTAFQLLLIHIAKDCSQRVIESASIVDDLLSTFDWDGMINLRNMNKQLFETCGLFLHVDFNRLRKKSPKLSETVFIGFEKNQHAISRIVTLFDEWSDIEDLSPLHPFLGFPLIMMFFFGMTLPDVLVQIIWKNSGISSSFLGFHPLFLLNHTSSNCNRHHQPVLLMELLCERIVRSSPQFIFEQGCSTALELSPLFLTNPLFGLHPLFFRGILPLHKDIHLLNFVFVVLYIIDSTTWSWLHYEESLFLSSPPPRIIEFFAQPICSIHSMGDIQPNLRHFLNYLLPSCAPFGECKSFALIFKEFSTIRKPHTQLDEDDLDVLKMLLDLSWLSIPTSFDSPLLTLSSSMNWISAKASDIRKSESESFQHYSFRATISQSSRMAKDVESPSFMKWLISPPERIPAEGKHGILTKAIKAVSNRDWEEREHKHNEIPSVMKLLKS
ncbi:hypothetical protein BLNAU_20443 [Blattamonas nauphoetae]|uniref:Uncharacterized protein n=1 Tax=Blattamonas nauphoetae TaxID=2049346 RepID=A0ABQ9WYQ6_9EUKA|nr:hypothetical protein BLNAU_20443 [Blattamonas nauphoetae]